MDTLKYVFGNYVDCDDIRDYFEGQGADTCDLGFENPDNAYYITEKGNVDFMRKDSPMFKMLGRYGRMEEFKVMPDKTTEKAESCDGRRMCYGFHGNPVSGLDLMRRLEKMGGSNSYKLGGTLEGTIYYFEKPCGRIYASYEEDIDDNINIEFIDAKASIKVGDVKVEDSSDDVLDSLSLSLLVTFETKVLVRNSTSDKWIAGVYGKRDAAGLFYIIGCKEAFRFCRPFKGNEDLYWSDK